MHPTHSLYNTITTGSFITDSNNPLNHFIEAANKQYKLLSSVIKQTTVTTIHRQNKTDSFFRPNRDSYDVKVRRITSKVYMNRIILKVHPSKEDSPFAYDRTSSLRRGFEWAYSLFIKSRWSLVKFLSSAGGVLFLLRIYRHKLDHSVGVSNFSKK